jgi:hypothetical protein
LAEIEEKVNAFDFTKASVADLKAQYIKIHNKFATQTSVELIRSEFYKKADKALVETAIEDIG